MLFLPCRIRFQPLAGQFFGTNSLYVKAPTFPHLRKRRGFFINIGECPNRRPVVSDLFCPAACPLPRYPLDNRRKLSRVGGTMMPGVPASGRQQVVRTAGQGRGLSPRVNRDAPRPDTVPFRLPGACAASGPPAGHWKKRLRCRRHWPPGPWRNGRIWSCP